jgi:hypothetical protein
VGDGSVSAAGGGEFVRAKRLRRLLRVLQSPAAARILTTFKARVLAAALVFLAVHVGAFAAVVALMARGAGELHHVAAAGASRVPKGVRARACLYKGAHIEQQHGTRTSHKRIVFH